MSYRYDSEIAILNSYGKASSYAKAELYETWDRLRDLTNSGPTLGGSGLGKFGGVLLNLARMFGASSFIPTFGSEAINIPGTSYYAPITGGTGIDPGGQAAFGLAPFSNFTGLPVPGGAAPVSGSVTPLARLQSLGVGSLDAVNDIGFMGFGDPDFPMQMGTIGGLPEDGVFAGGAVNAVASGATAPGGALTYAANGAGLAAGTAAGAGFGRNWVLPAAGIVSGIGGLLTTLGPYFGPFGIAAAGTGAIMNGVAGAVLQSFQHVSNRILSNADTILTNKVKNLETTVKMLDAQQDIVKKLLKESMDGDKKMLENL